MWQMFVLGLSGFPPFSPPDIFAAIVTKCNRQNKMALSPEVIHRLYQLHKKQAKKKITLIGLSTLFIFFISAFTLKSYLFLTFKY